MHVIEEYKTFHFIYTLLLELKCVRDALAFLLLIFLRRN